MPDTLAKLLFAKDNPAGIWAAEDEATRLFYRLEAARLSAINPPQGGNELHGSRRWGGNPARHELMMTVAPSIPTFRCHAAKPGTG